MWRLRQTTMTEAKLQVKVAYLQDTGQQLQRSLVISHGRLKAFLLHANISEQGMYICTPTS